MAEPVHFHQAHACMEILAASDIKATPDNFIGILLLSHPRNEVEKMEIEEKEAALKASTLLYV